MSCLLRRSGSAFEFGGCFDLVPADLGFASEQVGECRLERPEVVGFGACRERGVVLVLLDEALDQVEPFVTGRRVESVPGSICRWTNVS